MKKLKIHSDYKPTDEQKKASEKLAEGIERGLDYQVLLGVTGSGKTFTLANVIEKLQRPTLVFSHNKTLAAQLYQEFRDFFPDNAVSYFVSYYDFYQPEAYIPATDTYIEKDADINELIDKLRLATTSNLLTRADTIVVASVSCIYNIGSPKEYGDFIFEAKKGLKMTREKIIDRLIDLQYVRADYGFHRGTFRVRGDSIDIFPAYQDESLRVNLERGIIKDVVIFNPISGQAFENDKDSASKSFTLYPAKHFITDPYKNKKVFDQIRSDLALSIKRLKSGGKDLEAHRLSQRVNYDLEMIQEVGYVKGIENYSRYFDGRSPGDPPFTLLDYFKEPYGDDWLVAIDESHMTFPQIRGMYSGDFSRKQTLIDYGFRLPAAMDNRPLKFDEFMRRIPNFIATSATPSAWELSLAQQSYKELPKAKKASLSKNGLTEQLLRPTGIPDPLVEIRPIENQVAHVIEEIKKQKSKKQRTLVTTLTKRAAEDLSSYLEEQDINVHYLHSDIQTLERTDVLDDLRKGTYDAIVGVNLLREGLDLPEVALVAILDADKEGFLRSEVSLVQTMGRAARHVEGKVILYADTVTKSIKNALSEIKRRRDYQTSMNKKLGIMPRSITKPIRERLVSEEEVSLMGQVIEGKEKSFQILPSLDIEGLTPLDRKRLTSKLRREMKTAAQDLNFELAIEIRDKIKEIESVL
ncbi:excinuclease ABC subunit B [Candidatus Woesebacteria bacterium RIFCSPLOWO2_01_FULL_39_61]|uniref:UvrABC system protein B n=1 Tax=Candidatus Woesebacteria bacterium RIFCSPHIGHO2_02_FULL_39_13 TaxID=1802505 RepID=A0A1F7Z273_9BACT|nr:MAG: excinuclease ABC subunit B [Candidatus Woesebacteria bacterium RIFCSPHIGHO2_01_FULL_39_95]OGM33682.1 MAG: excinuclease ABC subunit B [Candidatus Woesebacteria bacterium RIFCSPHIGHO2_02_FULL_39_13]OGM38918.1 MAG: excinuclease ABC subunit B [Candidatus Woesebacteria bacterium RIFCSPHIGHO2_12_FULL_40_20]OGM68130.1 MAG: excinuclease ABC subunit B [Candidatus Woesebacteria bacterium RIFCSPLOWO2_01_FULL_39_61]